MKCQCGAAQAGAACACGILQRSYASDHDWRDEAQTTAADNARLCRIVEVADELAAQVDKLLHESTSNRRAIAWRVKRLHAALDAYKAIRNGQ